MKTTLAVGLALFFCLHSTFAQSNSAAPPVGTADAETGASAERAEPRSVATVLHQRIAEIAFEDLPLDQVVDWLAATLNVNIVVRWETLRDAGVARDKAISMAVRNMRISQVLWLLMNEAGGTDTKLAYRGSGNLLLLSTAADLGNEQLVRVYDVSDLIVRVQNFAGPQVGLEGQGGGGNTEVFVQAGGTNDEDQPPNANANNGEIDPDVARLMEIIRQAIEPDSWEASGRGSIMAYRRQLIVRNTIAVHQALGGPVSDGAD